MNRKQTTIKADRPLQRELLIPPRPQQGHQDNPSRASSENPPPSVPERRSRHPLSQACGDLPPAAREELIKRVEQSGSVRGIPTLDGRILLDWELYNSALDLGLPVRLEEFQGHDPVAFVVVHRLRQPRWDHGQRAVIAVRLYAWLERGRPENPVHSTALSPPQGESNPTPEAPATTAEMAEAALVSPTFITRAKRVHELGRSEAVISGNLKFAEAHRQVRLVLDAGLADAVRQGKEKFEAACHRSQVVADAGLLKGVKTNELTFDDAYRMALAGETGERAPARPRPLTKAELDRRVEELEDEKQTLQSDLAHTAARADAAEAEVKRLTALLPHPGTAA